MRAAVLATLLVATGCRDSPREVLTEATEAASSEDLGAVKAAFSVATVQRLKRHWAQQGIPVGTGWKDLSSRLTTGEGEPLEVGDEQIHGEYARVKAKAGVNERDYYLRKEDGRWRLELGAGMRFRKARRAAEAADKPPAGDDGKGAEPKK